MAAPDVAGPVYLTALVLSATLLGASPYRYAGVARREQRLLAARVLVVVGVTVGAAVVPLVAGVHGRAVVNGPQHAQSEVVVTEAAGVSMASGRDPYGSSLRLG